jgi:hypothetical protein
MDYAYRHVLNAAELDWDNTPLRRKFKQHLALVAAALKAIEWSDSGDSSEEAAEEAIMQCLADVKIARIIP